MYNPRPKRSIVCRNALLDCLKFDRCHLWRFPEKVIPLYSAVHNEDASKGQNEVGKTKREEAGRGRCEVAAREQSDTGSAVGRRADDRAGAASVSGGDDTERLSRECSPSGDASGLEAHRRRGGGGGTAHRDSRFGGARGLEWTQTLGGEVSGGSKGPARVGGSPRAASPNVSHDPGLYAPHRQGSRRSVAGAGARRVSAALPQHDGGRVKPDGLWVTQSQQSQTAEKNPSD